MPLSSSPSLALALLGLVALTGALPLASSSRDHGVAATTADGAPPLEEHELLMLDRFHGWMAEHGRSYATAEEKLRRFEIYKQNVEFIEAANRDGRLTYTLGENAFTDLTHEEFMATHTKRAPWLEEDDVDEEEMVITTRAGDVSEGPYLPAVDKVPDRINWTAEGKVTGVKDQEHCSSCWAFTAVAVIESAYAIAKRVAPLVLSEQELIDCDSDDHGCTSGYPVSAIKWVKRNGGIALDSQYPYKGSEGVCQEKKKRLQHAVRVRDFGFVKKSEEALMEAVVRRPVAVGFYYNDECFTWYKEGVYNGMCIKNGKLIGPACSGPKYLNHDLAIVGYVGKGNDTHKYWIAKNSWGKGWGQQGYVWIKKDVADPEGLCGIVKNRPSYPIV